jgi:hypothetical protein
MEIQVLCPACGKILTAYEAGMQKVRAYIRQPALVTAIGCYRRLSGTTGIGDIFPRKMTYFTIFPVGFL